MNEQTTAINWPAQDARIARLPDTIREQINRRLEKGEAGQQIADWLNTLPEVNSVMAAAFAGLPVTEADVDSWKLGGYRNWEAQQEALEAARQFGADAAELEQAAGGQLADHLALCLTARIAVALREPAYGGEDATCQLQRLRELCADLVALRKGDHNAQWLRIEREKLDLALKEFEQEEGARNNAIKQPSKDPKDWVMSQETRDRVRAELARL
jgi:hypothetical protein